MAKRHSSLIAYLHAQIKPEVAGGELPLLHRLAIAYLMLPVLVYLLGWFEWWFGIPVSALVLLGLRRALSGSWRLRLRTVALLAVALMMLTAAGGVFDLYNVDWFHHRTLLLELGRYPWPTYHGSAHDQLAGSNRKIPVLVALLLAPASRSSARTSMCISTRTG